jgi:hypothetical protein
VTAERKPGRWAMARWVWVLLLGISWAGVVDAREWRIKTEQPFCVNRDDVLEYLLVMNVEGFRGKQIPGCTRLKEGLRVTMVNDEEPDQTDKASGLVKIRVVLGRKVLVGYTFADER